MMLTAEKYYFRFGLRKLQHLTSPRVYTWISFRFPKDSIYHHNSYDEQSVGPDMKEPYYQAIEKKIPIKFINELVSTGAGVMKKQTPFAIVAKNWLVENRKKFMMVNDFKPFLRNPLVPCMYNYDTLSCLYKYPNMPISKYNMWKDRYSTVWTKINESVNNDKRNHYVVIELPDQVASVSQYSHWSKIGVMPAMMEVFPTYKELNLLELWKFIAPNDKNPSIIRQIVNVENYSKINLVLKYKNKWCMLNMAYLYKWIKKDQNEQDIDVPGILQSLPKEKMQRLLLVLVMKLQESEAKDAKPEDSDSIDALRVRGVINDSVSSKVYQSDNIEKSSDSEINEDLNLDDSLLNDNLVITDDVMKDIEDTRMSVRSINDTVDKVLAEHGDEEGLLKSSETSSLVPSRKRKSILEVSDDKLEEYIYKDNTSREVLEDIVNSYKDDNIISNIEYKKLLKEIESSDNIKTAYTNGLMRDFIKITPEDLAIDEKNITLPTNENIDDNSMLKSSLLDFDSGYIRKVMRKDIAACVHSIQKAGIILQNYEVEEVNSVMGDYEIHKMKLKPLDGQPCELKFRMPKMTQENTFIVNGIPYRFRKQQSDLPIVKINRHKVALSTYYGKTFVYRSEAKADDTYEWINDNIAKEAMSGENPRIKKVKLANVFNNLAHTPRLYSSLSTRFAEIKLNQSTFNFEYNRRAEIYGEKNISKYEKDGAILCGMTMLSEPILMKKDNSLYAISKNGNLKPLGSIYALTGLNAKKAPVEFATTDILGKRVPVGIILGYFLGITNLLRVLKVKYKLVDKNKKLELSDDEWAVNFKDKKLIFDRKNARASLIMAGFRYFKNSIKYFNYDLFEKPDVYLNIMESRGLTSRHIKEINNINSMFVDPITKTVLEDMNEPVTYLGLLLRATELLDNDYYPDDLDFAVKRVRGVERMVGAIYQELTKAIRDYKYKNTRGNSKIEMSPFAVWTNISEDQSKIPVADINPMEHLKEEETLTMVGSGGRSKESLVKRTRAYHKSHIGVVSETTVGSGDVGINTYLCANPQFRSLRGRTKMYDSSKGGAANFISTTSLSAIAMENDDSKRVNFISIQMSHDVYCEGSSQPIVRTGYESIVPQRCHEPFAVTAKKPCTVISKDDYGIIIEDEDGRRGYRLGTVYGTSEGTYYDHEMVSLFKKGDKIKPGEPIVYNTHFFEPDILNPRQIIWKTSFLAKTALYESAQTLEDSGAISKRVSSMLTTSIIKVRDFVIDFKQGVRELLTVGSLVEPDTVLMIIEDAITTELNVFDKETIKSLQRLSNKAPKAKYKGKIDRIEVFYNGEIKNMSKTLRALVEYSDKEMAKRYTSSGKLIHNGQVDREYRVSGSPLLEDTANVKVYIKVVHDAGLGDKGVFGNQLKSTFGEVMNYDMYTEAGEPIDAIFGYKSIHNRVVLSPFLHGTTNTLLKLTAKQASKIYFGE